jgi:hypothetical protein
MVKRMLGPAADEVAEMWRDQAKLYRYERQLNCVGKAETMAQKARFTPQAVPLKILFPLLEGASLEEDESLHTMWAALLANAASPISENKVRPGYIALLKQMSPDEAGILRWVFDRNLKLQKERPAIRPECFLDELRQVHNEFYKSTSGATDELAICLSSLQAADLLKKSDSAVDDHIITSYGITYRGSAFVIACSAPESVQ